MNNGHVLVLGSGPAGLACALHLLARDWQVDRLAVEGASPGPAIVTMGPIAQTLLLDAFGIDVRKLPQAHALNARWVSWDGSPPTRRAVASTCVPLESLVSTMLGRALSAGLHTRDSVQPADYDWVVNARGKSCGQEASGVLRFGSRTAVVAQAALSDDAPRDCCVMEAVEDGWLFLAPHGIQPGALQAVTTSPCVDAGQTLHRLLRNSLVVRPFVQALDPMPGALQAMPRLANRPAQPGRIMVGDAAFSLDPLSGDGVANGLRSAILAASLIDAVHQGEEVQPCLQHYEWRLRQAAAQHLRTCVEHYRTARFAASWHGEIEVMEAGIVACEGNVDEKATFRLVNQQLVRTRAPPPSLFA